MAEIVHGRRTSYTAMGCRCRVCCQANNAYNRVRYRSMRVKDWDGLVSARRAQRHILRLAEKGIGYKTVGKVSGVAKETLLDIKLGRRLKIRSDTQKRILAVACKPVLQRSFVPAGRVWSLLDALKQEGYTTAQIRERMGFGQRIQINKKRVYLKTLVRVERVYREMTA